MSKCNLLILSPYLDLSGGVATFVKSLKGQWGVNERYFYRGGRGKHLAKYFNTIVELSTFLLGLLYYKNSKVFINTSLNKKAYTRDKIFCKISIFLKKDVYLFIHGWDTHFFDEVKGEFNKSSFFKAKKIYVLAQSFKDSLVSVGFFEKDIIVEHTVVQERFFSEFKSFEKKFSNAPIHLLFLARLEAVKGIFTVLETFKTLFEKDSNFILNVAGSGTETDQVKKWIAQNRKLPINFHGRVEGDAKINLFKASHFYLLPTTHPEGLPISILEAITAGCIVFVTPAGGLKDFFEDRDMGFLLQDSLTSELISKIEFAVKDFELLKKIASNNISRGQELYTPLSLINRIKSNIYG
ncbi:glycosyltransferase family 4 protein [Mariniflexile litorale]|uniref:Glycosyltransferase family 4 protein n=1 Tax=Mariniflexile litorale TaxID=3045158 RepID=A0AAU7EHA8_9FLAO|nr:glycosyltransferase family 4 protein [Mariniflexile sp. KMM 9835]MDQ8209920.1 glycosyltransferase family 4 protein [Mariniflexile sp. KMM 9835]